VPRKVLRYDTDQFKNEFPELKNSIVEIYLDAEDQKNLQKIGEALKQAGAKKIKTVMAIILKNEYYDHIYKIEDKNVTAIKLKAGKSKNQNYRIYCREIFKEGKKVVLITPYIKKVEKNQEDPTIIRIIETIKNYDYEL
jgi:hypothetical protein